MASRKGTNEEQIANVGAGDQQNENDDGEHYFERGEESARVVEGRLPERPELNAAAAVGCGEIAFKALGNGGDFLLGLLESDAGLEAHVGFDPAGAAVFKFVFASLERFLHGHGHPELHGPAHKGSVKAFGRDAHNSVKHAIKPLRFANNLRVGFESGLPQLITDHGNRMRVTTGVFAGLEGAPEQRVNSEGVKIICRNDAAGGDLGAISEAERSAHDFADDEGIDELAVLLEVEKVWPGNGGAA